MNVCQMPFFCAALLLALGAQCFSTSTEMYTTIWAGGQAKEAGFLSGGLPNSLLEIIALEGHISSCFPARSCSYYPPHPSLWIH